MNRVESIAQLEEILADSEVTAVINVKLGENIKYAPLTMPGSCVLSFIQNNGWYIMSDNPKDHGKLSIGYDSDKKQIRLNW